MPRERFKFSIYTIAHPDKLAKAARSSRAIVFSEAKVWKTGCALWSKADAQGKTMPVVFGDATNCERLLYWGILTKQPEIEGKTTSYSVKALRKIKGHSPQDLRLKSSGKKIATNFRRPYAIVETPPFLE